MTHSALLVMDVQHAVVARHPDPDYLPRLATAINAARTADIPVVYVTVGFRPGAPEVHPRNKMFGAMAGRVSPPEALRIPDPVAPRDNDPVITKRRVSGFTGSDLDLVLRSQNITDLILTGIATSGVVLSTLREAADRDYGLTVLADACLDADPEVHRILTEKIFPMQAEVVTVAEWSATLQA